MPAVSRQGVLLFSCRRRIETPVVDKNNHQLEWERSPPGSLELYVLVEQVEQHGGRDPPRQADEVAAGGGDTVGGTGLLSQDAHLLDAFARHELDEAIGADGLGSAVERGFLGLAFDAGSCE